jgi:hypothetical protein
MARPTGVSSLAIEEKETRSQLKRASYDPMYSVDVVENLVYDPITSALNRMVQPLPASAFVSAVAYDLNYTVAMGFDGANNPIYIGRAPMGSATSASVWQLRKLTFDGANNPTNIQWKNGDDNFDNTWDDRANPPYS